jgi:hypothetical protein
MKRVALRIVGIANIAFAVLGFWYFGTMLWYRWRADGFHHWPGSPGPRAWFAFFLIVTMSSCLVGTLGFLGVRLIKCDQSAIRPTLWVLFAEIACVLVDVVVFWQLLPMMFGVGIIHITVGLFGIALMPFDPQLITGYPLIAIAFLLLARQSKAPEKHTVDALKGLSCW